MNINKREKGESKEEDRRRPRAIQQKRNRYVELVYQTGIVNRFMSSHFANYNVIKTLQCTCLTACCLICVLLGRGEKERLMKVSG